MAVPVVVVASGGLPVTEDPNGTPFTQVDAFGFPVTIVASGGLPVVFVDDGLPSLAAGTAFLVDSSGNYLVDANGAYLIGAV